MVIFTHYSASFLKREVEVLSTWILSEPIKTITCLTPKLNLNSSACQIHKSFGIPQWHADLLLLSIPLIFVNVQRSCPLSLLLSVWEFKGHQWP